MFEGFTNRALRDLVEGHTLDTGHVAILILILILGALFSLFLFGAVGIEFVGEVRGDGFAFAVRVRRQEDVVS
jgi:hypothetical protein